MRHQQAQQTAAQAGQAEILQERDADHDRRQDQRRHQKRRDCFCSRKRLAEQRVSSGNAHHKRNRGRATCQDKTHADRRQIGRVAQHLAKPGKRQALRRDGQVGRRAERRQHHDYNRDLQEYDDGKCKCRHAGIDTSIVFRVHAIPAHLFVRRLDSQITPTAMKVRANDSAEPLGQSSSCMNSS